jgi:pyruvate,water dikinase
MRRIHALDEVSEADRERVGGKAVALAALHRAGCPVPRTLCLTTEAYERFVENARLRAVLHQELGRKSFRDMRWEEIWDAALRIRNRFLRAPIPDEIAREVGARIADDLGGRTLVVRSSAPGEDEGGTSFAGLHDSFTGVQGPEAALEAIRKVWASLWTDRALLYRRELGLDADTSAMAVLVQEMVVGSVSGIAFGVHPSDPTRAVVEAVYGLNQGLVDGTLEPDRWFLERTTGRVLEHAPPAERLRLVARGSRTLVEPVPPPHGERPPLDASQLADVFAAVRGAGDLFGAPQDVEWTWSGERPVLLQSRPVTTAPAGEGDRRAWYLSLTRSLANLRGLRARVEDELLPAMAREAAAIGRTDLAALEADALAAEIERRRALYDRWVDTYWSEFIPLAHGIRLFGQFYDEIVRPEDPHEFMELLAATPLLSVRRNRALAGLAARVRGDAALRARLEAGKPGDAAFESALAEFEGTFGDAVFLDQACFGSREHLTRLLLSLAEAPPVADATPGARREALSQAFFAAVPEDRRGLAEELLELGRASYRLRDDDNIHLARLEAPALEAVEEGRRRLGLDPRREDLDDVLRGLRHPNLVVEPRAAPRRPAVEPGFRPRPRQLVGQPAGPGVAAGPARVVLDVEDLRRFRSGEVLVCDAIDPNMTFVVPLACAVVERRGGMLIHGAIIAREYGLPCVTGIPDATALIATGDRLSVDGYLGIVTCLGVLPPKP